MRDFRVFQMQEANAKRTALLLGQFQFIKTRQEAFERVLKASNVMDRIRWAFFPSHFLQVVDGVQRNLLDAANRALEAAASKVHIEVP
jgi:hypothetical protein